MKTKYLFASSAIAAVFVAMAPAHAQILGGGLRGGVTGMQSATFGDGFGRVRGSVNDQTAASVSGHARAPTHAIDRASQVAKSGASEGMQAGERTKNDAVTEGRRAADVGASDAAIVGTAANASANQMAADAATGVTTATQTETSAGKASNGSTPRIALPANQATPSKPSDSHRSPKRRPAADADSDTSGTTTEASASASMNASVTS